MSADNGVYIARFGGGEREYRVVHCQAIENCWDYRTGEENHRAIVNYFGESEAFADKEKVRERAFAIADQISEEGLPLEYGIREIAFLHSFSTYEKLAGADQR